MTNQIKTVVLLGALSAVLIGFGGLLGSGYLYGFTALALLMNLGAFFYSDRLVLAVSRARELQREEAPGVHLMVEELAARAGIPKPRLYLIEDAHANAFATGRNPSKGAVAVTTGILQLLSARELRGVLAHELAHIRNRDILVASVAAALASAVSSIANAFQLSTLFGGGASREDEEAGGSPLATLALAFVAPVAATLIQLGISRSREFLADEAGARISGDPEALARALEKLESAAERLPGDAEPATASLYIVNPLLNGAAWSRWFSTHPPLRERVGRLRAMALTGVAA